mmetsp:Transcript_19802/g.44923  ORF Transcript_19802/g.44923 Transcript_19802/m.44923 type:complete len:329 (-) Transcript_19802:174-1160(-)
MPSTGTVKSFNPAKGWGFIDCCGVDIFVHVKHCVTGQPEVGDVLTFDIEKNPKHPEQPQAKNVKGCSGQRADEINKQLIANMLGIDAPAEPKPEVPKGAFQGMVCFWNADKGFGFIEPDIYKQPVLLQAQDCSGQPAVGDRVYFDVEPFKMDDSMQLKAINVSNVNAKSPIAKEEGYGPMSNEKGGNRSNPMDGGKSTNRVRGLVHSWIADKGWGFATIPGCTDIFVHSHHCVGGFMPTQGDMLEFELERGKKKDGTQSFTAINITLAPEKSGPSIGPLTAMRENQLQQKVVPARAQPQPSKSGIPVGVQRLLAKQALKASAGHNAAS